MENAVGSKSKHTVQEIETAVQKLFGRRGKKTQAMLIRMLMLNAVIRIDVCGLHNDRLKSVKLDAQRIFAAIHANPKELIKRLSGLDGEEASLLTIRLKNQAHHSSDYGLLDAGIDKTGRPYVVPCIPEHRAMDAVCASTQRYEEWRKVTAKRRRQEGSFRRRVRMSTS